MFRIGCTRICSPPARSADSATRLRIGRSNTARAPGPFCDTSPPKSSGHGAFHLALGEGWIQLRSAIHSSRQLEDLDFAGLGVHLHLDCFGNKVVRTRLIAVATLVRKLGWVIPLADSEDWSTARLIQPPACDLTDRYTATERARCAAHHDLAVAHFQVLDRCLELVCRGLPLNAVESGDVSPPMIVARPSSFSRTMAELPS